MLNLDALNVNQRRAVRWNNGPMLVLAGPGAGKTRVLTTRVARLIQETPEKRFRVLALTFTTKAAEEMRGRVAQLLGPRIRRARLTTFHGFAADMLRQHGSHVGLRPDFAILNQDEDRHLILQGAIEDASHPGIPAGATGQGLLPMINRLLREGQDGRESPDTPLPFVAPDRQWIRPIYRAYIRRLIEGNHLDFGALLVCCLRLLGERPGIARDYGIVYPFACVDEYQDTNTVQDLILRALYPDRDSNLFVVADDDQTIYQWNGASPERLRRLRTDYHMEVVQLPESFRCPVDVVRLANNLIAHNSDRAADKKPLVSATATASDPPVVRVRRFADCAAELSWVAEDIRNRSFDPGDCAVLARTTKLVRAVADVLSLAGLPSYVVKRKAEFESPLLRFLHSSLRLVRRPGDTEQLAFLCEAFCELAATRVRTTDAEAAALPEDSLLAGFLAVAIAGAHTSARPLLDTLRNDLLDRGRYRDFIRNTFDWRDRTPRRTDTDCDEEAEERNIWRSLTTEIRHHLGTDPPLSQFLQQLDLRQKTSPPSAGDVQCLTIHLAKGKEFDHVYLIGLADGQLPSFHAAQGGPAAMEEERRNCFVAITRVQASLTLTHADSYFGWATRPSRFFEEMNLPSGDMEIDRRRGK